MDQDKLAYFKTKLTEEKALLERELKTVGQRNPDNPADWEAKTQGRDIDPAERNEVADRVEGYETNVAILGQLEPKYNEVKAALARMEEGNFGICSVCDKEIEEERLEANPAATTCMAHL
jgi:RNA polymerase-binding transcription factor DksA